ncbi:MAG: elongation factor 1-beta [Candidatus Heimdallarchaeaceae archaeon]
MGEVLLVYDIRPESPDIKPTTLEERVRANLPDRVRMQNTVEERPLAFGLISIVAQFIIPEEDGMQDNLEDYLISVEGVSSINLDFVTRL